MNKDSEKSLRLKLGLPIQSYVGQPPFGYVLDRSRNRFYPKQDELELLLEAKELHESGISYVDIVHYIKSKSDIKISPEGLRKMLLNRPPYKVIKDSLQAREEAYKWMSQNLTQAESA